MRKHKLINNFVVGLLLCCATFTASAQNEAPVTDSVFQITTEEDTDSIFDQMNDTLAISSRSVPDTVLTRMRTDKDYWYANTVPERQKKQPISNAQKEKWYYQKWFTNFLWFLVIGSSIAILILFLASSNIKIFRKKPASIPTETEEVTEETIFGLHYEKEIEKAIANKNFRLAIRLWYLRILKELAEKELIRYKQDRTNREYVRQLQDTAYYKSFHHLTRSFEYVWYGKFELSPDVFDLLQKDFLTFKQQLP